MRKIREILRLSWQCQLSQNKVHESTGISRASIGEYVRRALAAGLGWPLPEGLDDAALEELLFPSKMKPTFEQARPDFELVCREMRRKGASLSVLWQEYKLENPDGLQYSQFCQLYREWRKNIDLVMRQEHRAGEKVFSDFAGGTLPVTDPTTGEVSAAHIFVATLGASSYTFAEAFYSEDSRAWCMGHAHSFSFFGGAPEVIVPDNPKAAVRIPCRYEPEMNVHFHHMASHYGFAVIPARVRKPRDKAKVESAVNVVTKWILFTLRHRTFFSIHEVNQAIKTLLPQLNERPFKKMTGSRKELFELLDKPALQPLPHTNYEYTEIAFARVNIDYHIEFEGHLYSVPFNLVKRKVELRVTERTIEIFDQGKRVASHVRSFVRGKPSTLPDHMPRAHREYLEWTPTRIISWAAKAGPNTASVVDSIMNSRLYPEQAYRSCLGIIRLGKTHGDDRLEAACERALAINGCSYKSIKSILSTGLDRRRLVADEAQPKQLKLVHPNIRGPEYYKEMKDVD